MAACIITSQQDHVTHTEMGPPTSAASNTLLSAFLPVELFCGEAFFDLTFALGFFLGLALLGVEFVDPGFLPLDEGGREGGREEGRERERERERD